MSILSLAEPGATRSPSQRPIALSFRSVTHRYGERTALDRLNLDVRQGEVLALLGPNGAGKSTTISVLLGLIRPQIGFVQVLGTEPGRAVADGRVGAMLQSGSGVGLPPGVRVDHALRLVRRLYHRPAPVAKIVERADIGSLLHRRTDRLSGGQAQRVRFALAIAGDPEVVFLDEPTSAMDVESRQVFWRMMREFGDEGRTVVFATHHLSEADQIADRVVVLNHGRVVADGPGATLKAAVATRRLRFVTDLVDRALLSELDGVTEVEVCGTSVSIDSLDADATTRDLVAKGVPFRDLEVTSAGLEQAFVALTCDAAVATPLELHPVDLVPTGPVSADAVPAPYEQPAHLEEPAHLEQPAHPEEGVSHLGPSAVPSGAPHPTSSHRRPRRAATKAPREGWRTRFEPLIAFASFEVGRLLRSWKFLAITVGFPVIFYLLFLGDHTAGKVVDGTVPWRVYLMVAMCSFGALVAALNAGGTRLSMERASGWARQLRVTPIPAWSYVGTKIFASMLVVLPVIVLVEAVGAGFGDVRLSAAAWLGLTIILWATSLPFAVLGVFVGFLVATEAAFPVVTGLMFVLGYFGGLFNPVDNMPGPLQVVAHLLPSYHNDALGLAVLDGQALSLSHWLVLGGYVVVLGLAIVWKHRSEEARGIA